MIVSLIGNQDVSNLVNLSINPSTSKEILFMGEHLCCFMHQLSRIKKRWCECCVPVWRPCVLSTSRKFTSWHGVHVYHRIKNCLFFSPANAFAIVFSSIVFSISPKPKIKTWFNILSDNIPVIRKVEKNWIMQGHKMNKW